MRSLIGELRSADPAQPQYDERVMELMREAMHQSAARCASRARLYGTKISARQRPFGSVRFSLRLRARA